MGVWERKIQQVQLHIVISCPLKGTPLAGIGGTSIHTFVMIIVIAQDPASEAEEAKR